MIKICSECKGKGTVLDRTDHTACSVYKRECNVCKGCGFVDTKPAKPFLVELLKGL